MTAQTRPFVLGVLLTDEWTASPNMGETTGDGASKAARMKTIRTSEGTKTILSGQSVGSWHRQTLYDRFGWPVSELQETISGRDTRSFYTQCQPIEFAEDDGRGYMAAVTYEDGTGKEKQKIPLTTKRTSPFMLSQFQSIAPNIRMNDYGILSRNLDELPEEVKGGLIFRAEVAAAAYAGLFALNLSELGKFHIGVGRDLLPFNDIQKMFVDPSKRSHLKVLVKRVLKPQSNSVPTDAEREELAPVVKAFRRSVNLPRGTTLVMPSQTRQARAKDLIAALAELEGGAHMTRRLYNVAPATALVAFMNGGNCLPPHIIRAVLKDDDDRGNKSYKFIVDIPRLHKILWDNADRFLKGRSVVGNGGTHEEEAVQPSLFFGTLGSPSIENEEQVSSFLAGEDKQYPLPKNLACIVCNGPREAIRLAASSIPEDWFETPQGATEVDSTLLYGEGLLLHWAEQEG